MIRFLRKLGCRKLLVLLTLCLVAAGGLWWRIAHDASSDIARGKLSLTRRWGWVNWGHAIPDAPAKLLSDVRAARPDTSGWITVTLHQGMAGNYGPIRASGGITRTYRAHPPKDEAELTALAWAVFRDTSEAFENMQACLPNALDPASWRSAYRPGDISGNRLSFFAALNGLTLKEIREFAAEVSPGEAMGRWTGGKETTWERPGGLGSTALPDGRDPWNPAWDRGAPKWELRAEEKDRLSLGWR